MLQHLIISKRSIMKQMEELANLLINPNGTTPIYNCLLYINDTQRNISHKAAFGEMDAQGGEVHGTYRFRTGSITKTFTATLIFQLIEEGILHLQDEFLTCLKNDKTKKLFSKLIVFEGVNYSDRITVKNLLEHKSGIRDYIADDKRFSEFIMDFPNQNWDWKMIMEKYFEFHLNEKGTFQPNTDFYYSDTNYLLLAVLIEELTNMSYHEVLEKKILGPLSLNDTYLEFYQDEKNSAPIIFPYQGTDSLKNVNTSFDWGGGGLISSCNDMDIFIRSLLAGKLFKEMETLQLMLNFDDNPKESHSKRARISYGMGLQQKIIGGLKFFGHNGAYGSMMFYNPEKEISIVLTINQVLAPHKSEWLMKNLVEDFIS